MDLRRIYWLAFLLFLFSLPAAARGRAYGWCEQGAQTISVLGYTSSVTTPVQRSYPSCSVTVYLTGTLTLATIYSDNSSTPLGNPFTANTIGYWFFYADNAAYDVKFSNGGIPSPFTLGGVSAIDPAGAGVGCAASGSSGTPQASNGSGGCQAAVAANIIALFSGCSGVLYLGADGACHTPSGGGATIPNTTNVLCGSGTGNGADCGFPPTGAGIVSRFCSPSATLLLAADGTCHVPGNAPVTLTTVPSSGTPTFIRSSQIQEWTNALTANVMGSTVSGALAGDILVFTFTDSAGGHTVAWPTGFTQAATVALKAGGVFTQAFYWTGAAAVPITPGVTNQSKFVNPPTSVDPGCTLATDLGGQWMDSTSGVTTHFKVCANVSSAPAWVTVF